MSINRYNLRSSPALSLRAEEARAYYKYDVSTKTVPGRRYKSHEGEARYVCRCLHSDRLHNYNKRIKAAEEAVEEQKRTVNRLFWTDMGYKPVVIHGERLYLAYQPDLITASVYYRTEDDDKGQYRGVFNFVTKVITP